MRVFLIGLLAGCGVSEEDELRALDDGDWARVCEDIAPETHTCDMGEGVTRETLIGGEACPPDDTDGNAIPVADTCEATVGDLFDCYSAWSTVLRSDPCSTDLPFECSFFNGCF